METAPAPALTGAAADTAVLAIDARNISRRFGNIAALDGVTLSIRRGEFFSLLGPSGCGKTTFLRILAGLDTPDAGTLEIGGASMVAVPAHRRAVNTVFQSYALFPHLNVAENVAFGLRMKNVPAPERDARIRSVMALVRIGELARRRPHELSGGQRQRVALARAIVNEPEVLLLDEPLAALDVKLRRELQGELHALQRRLGITFVHVTHDQDEALSLSDRVAVLDHGRVVQVGPTEEIYERPRTRFVAQFVGGCNLIDAARLSADADSVVLRTMLGEVRSAVPMPHDRVTVAIRPERIVIGRDAKGPNLFRGIIQRTTYTGPETHVELRAGALSLKATLINSGPQRLHAGESVQFSFPPEAIIALLD